MTPLLRAALVVGAFSAPQAATACADLSQHVWMCARDTVWETATWEQNGDGATIRMQDFTFNFSEQFPGKEKADENTTLQDVYGFYSDFLKENRGDDTYAPKVIRTTLVGNENVTALQVLQRGVALWDDKPYLETSMLAQVGTHRILLELRGPQDMPLDTMDAAAADILSFLRDSCADPVSCAEDYEWPPTAPLKDK
jgi:hypothetical protein